MNNIKNTYILTLIIFFLIANAIWASPMDLEFQNQEQLILYIKNHNQLIKENPLMAKYYLQRADAFFLNNNFDKAVDDYSKALKLDDKLNEAYLGRGLALARAGWLEESIDDLDIYIKRKPDSSFAYTKRGVRYLWLGNKNKARKDLQKAIQLDSQNAEAHDDLGVIFAQRMKYYEAADHFLSAIELDPSYHKAYHNMALISYITGKDRIALSFIENSLALASGSRESWLLKSKILNAIGNTSEADEAQEEAEFLPEGNWSENIPIR